MTRQKLLAGLAIAMFAGLFAIDAIRQVEPFDLINFMVDLLETAMLALAVTMTTFVSFEAREMRRERYRLLDDLDVARRDGACWREASRAHVQGLSRAIASQFAAWGLTEAEADVAGLILKGLSHKEIATLRLGSEATVRQHATAVYRKSGLPGRAQLTAFFLEDLLMPVDPEGSNGGRVVALKAGR